MSTILYGITPTPQTLKGVSDVQKETVKGLKYPFGGETYVAKKATRGELIKGQIKQLLNTKKGERIMLPDFGIGIDQYLFEPLTVEMKDSLRKTVYTAIRRYIPYVTIKKIEISETQDIRYSGLPGIRIALIVSIDENSETISVNLDL